MGRIKSIISWTILSAILGIWAAWLLALAYISLIRLEAQLFLRQPSPRDYQVQQALNEWMGMMDTMSVRVLGLVVLACILVSSGKELNDGQATTPLAVANAIGQAVVSAVLFAAILCLPPAI